MRSARGSRRARLQRFQPSSGTSVESVIARYTGGRALTPGATLEEMGLSSLERIEMMVALEEALDTTIDETAFSNVKTIGDLERLTAAPGATELAPEPVEFPSWNRALPFRVLRAVAQPGVPASADPSVRVDQSRRIAESGQRKGPVIFAANHQSHMDVPVILAALPGRWRRRVATAMAKEFFKAHFFPDGYTRGKRFARSLEYLPVGRVLQHVPATAARGGRAPDAALCGRT